MPFLNTIFHKITCFYSDLLISTKVITIAIRTLKALSPIRTDLEPTDIYCRNLIVK